jgi:hypothetical protein
MQNVLKLVRAAMTATATAATVMTATTTTMAAEQWQQQLF